MLLKVFQPWKAKQAPRRLRHDSKNSMRKVITLASLDTEGEAVLEVVPNPIFYCIWGATLVRISFLFPILYVVVSGELSHENLRYFNVVMMRKVITLASLDREGEAVLEVVPNPIFYCIWGATLVHNFIPFPHLVCGCVRGTFS